MRVRVLVTASFAVLSSLAACAAEKPQTFGPSSVKNGPPPPPPDTKVLSFAVTNENLNVDKVGMRDGSLRPDGNRDHAFSATIDGPFDALFIVETNAKGEPVYGYRADTLVGGQDLPQDLGGVIDTGNMTVGIGVVENGRFLNGESGEVNAGRGLHDLTLYSPNTAALQAGDFVRLYVRGSNGGLAKSAPAPY